MQKKLVIAAVLIAALAACRTPPPVPPATPAPAPAPPVTAAPPAAAPVPAPARQTLASEQRRLAELFRGTPVAFTMQADGALRVTVPLQFCFDRAAVVVKPPLAAVLDRVAKSQRDQTSQLRVAAAPDLGKGGAADALARRRADTVRDYLQAQGIKASRLTVASLAQVAGTGAGAAAAAAGVEILVVDAAPH